MTKRHNAGALGRWGRGLCAIAGALIVGAATFACDTPVYEYTLQNWNRDPYQVRYFHSGQEDAADARVNQYLERAARGTEGNANLSFVSVDVASLDANADSGHLRAWERHKGERLPLHVVTSPRGTDVFSGRLDLSASRSMLNSSKRSELAEQLSAGKQGVLLALLDPNAADNAAARGVVREMVALAGEQNIDMGVVEVNRTDAAEQWFVRQLLEVEDDLKDITRPMVFGVFGRGHILEPYVGKGITVENLAALVGFINGPCACEIKESNPGMDLLTDWNWQARAAGVTAGSASAPRFMLFDVEGDGEQDAEQVVQMPVLSTGQGASETGGVPGTQPATAGASGQGTREAPATSATPPLSTRTTTPRSAQAGPSSAQSPSGHEATQSGAVPTPSSQPEGLGPAPTPPPGTGEPPESAKAEITEGARGPKLPTIKPPPDPAAEFERENESSLGSSLSVGLAVTVGTVVLFAVAGGVLLVRRARES